jgi:hypothetical protein
MVTYESKIILRSILTLTLIKVITNSLRLLHEAELCANWKRAAVKHQELLVQVKKAEMKRNADKRGENLGKVYNPFDKENNKLINPDLSCFDAAYIWTEYAKFCLKAGVS